MTTEEAQEIVLETWESFNHPQLSYRQGNKVRLAGFCVANVGVYGGYAGKTIIDAYRKLKLQEQTCTIPIGKFFWEG